MSLPLDTSTVENPTVETESVFTRSSPANISANGDSQSNGNSHSNGDGHRNGYFQSNGRRSKGEAQSDDAKKTATKRNPIWEIHLLPVTAIGPNPFQPRQEFDEAEMEELASSVAEHGVQTPVIVRTVPLPEPKPARKVTKAPKHGAALTNGHQTNGHQTNGHQTNGHQSNGQSGDETPATAPLETAPRFRYELVVGERRLRACLKAGRKTIPAILRDDLSDAQAAELALIENVQRSNLNVIEEARGYKRLMLRFRFTEARIAKKVGKSIPTIQGAIKLLDLPDEVQTLLLKRQLSASHGHELLRLAPHPALCTSVALKALTEKLSATSLGTTPLPNARELKRRGSIVELGYTTKFDWRRECKTCPHKAFVTSGHVSYCLKPDEWQKKQSHALEMEKQEAARVLEEARKEGNSPVEASDLPAGSYRSLQWNDPPAGCTAQCPCRGQVSDPRDGTARIPVCLDPARLEVLRKAERQAQEAERERRTKALWEGAVERLGVESLCPLPVHEAESVTPLPGVNPVPAPEVPEASNRETADAEMSETTGLDTAETEKEDMEKAQPKPPESERPIAWSKAAPLLVLPILRGEGLPYGLRQNWEAVAQETASLLRVELPWDELMESEEEGELLRLLEAIAPTRLLVLGAALLLRQEASSAAHFPAPTPLLEFVLDLQPARQTELEETEEESDEVEPDEMESDENEVEDDGWEIDGLWDADTEDAGIEGANDETETDNGEPETTFITEGATTEDHEADVSVAPISAEAMPQDIQVSEGGNAERTEEPDFDSWNIGDEDGEDEDNWNDPQEDFEAD